MVILFFIYMFLRIWRNQYSAISRFLFNNSSSLLIKHRFVGAFCTTEEKSTTNEKEYTFFHNLITQKIESLIESGQADDLETLDRSLHLAKQNLGERSTQYNKKLIRVSKILLKFNVIDLAQKYLLQSYRLKHKYPQLKTRLPEIQKVDMKLAALYSKLKKQKQAKKFYRQYLQNVLQPQMNVHRMYICHAQLGKIYASQKNYQAALKYMRENIQIIAKASTQNLQYEFSSLFLIEHQWRQIVDFVTILYLKGQINEANRYLVNFIQLLSPSSITYQKNLEEAQQCLQKIGVKNQFLQIKIEESRKRQEKN